MPVYACWAGIAIRQFTERRPLFDRMTVIKFPEIMRIFILGAGATGSLLAQLLERQGHDVWCGDRNPIRARRFLGMKSTIAIATVNARNLRGIVRAAKGCDLIINASASVFNERVLRAALRLRARYLDLSSHLTRQPFKSEQLRYEKRFVEKKPGGGHQHWRGPRFD